MQNKDTEYTKVSFNIPKSLLDKFDQHAKEKGYQSRNKALIDLVIQELEL